MNSKRLPDNFKVKIVSFFLAFIMWMFVMEKEDPVRIESIENIPVSEITNMDEIKEKGLAIVYDEVLTVNLDLKGRRSSLLDYIRKHPEIKGSIENPEAGKNRLNLFLTAPTDIEYSFEPRVLYVTLEESIVSKENIELSQTGTPKEQFSIKSITTNEKYAYVEGTKSQVDKVAKLVGEVNVENANKDYSSKIRLVPVDSKNAEVLGVSVNKEFILADVKVEQSKDVPIELVFVNSQGDKVENSSIEPSIQTVTITGSPNIIQHIERVYTEDIPVQDINLYSDKGFDLQYIDGVNMSVNRVDLIVQKDKEKQYRFEIPSSEVKLLGDIKTDEIQAALPEYISVEFSSSVEYESILTAESILLKLDNREEKNSYVLEFLIEYPVSDLLMEPKVILLS